VDPLADVLNLKANQTLGGNSSFVRPENDIKKTSSKSLRGDNPINLRIIIIVAISGDRNVIKKEAEKILKYKGLTI